MPIIRRGKTKKWLIPLLIIVGIVLCLYFIAINWGSLVKVFQEFPAQVFVSKIAPEPAEEEEPATEEEFFELPEIQEQNYTEEAGRGEGITHLARRALKKYLANNTQDFEVTAEHKIYVEDYVARRMGYQWLEVGEKLEFSADLMEEALQKSAQLSSEQLQNLTQYAQLVPELGH